MYIVVFFMCTKKTFGLSSPLLPKISVFSFVKKYDGYRSGKASTIYSNIIPKGLFKQTTKQKSDNSLIYEADISEDERQDRHFPDGIRILNKRQMIWGLSTRDQ